MNENVVGDLHAGYDIAVAVWYATSVVRLKTTLGH
jgi:hypothetical protein